MTQHTDVAGPSGYGPKVTVRRSCSDCKACNSESYAVQGDSGHYVYCEHPSLPESKYIGDTNWNTPHWCPVSAPTTQPAPQQEAQEPVAWQYRSMPDVGGVWFECTKERADQRAAHPEKWEVRALYTAPQPSPAAQGDALSDAVRVSLDSLHADAAYLIGRLRDGSMPYARVIEIIRERIDAAKAAIRARAAQGDALDAARLDWLENDVGCRVFHLGKSWYTRDNFGMPYRKRASLREAIDAARAAQEGKKP